VTAAEPDIFADRPIVTSIGVHIHVKESTPVTVRGPSEGAYVLIGEVGSAVFIHGTAADLERVLSTALDAVLGLS
jgi:hypothetical protein